MFELISSTCSKSCANEIPVFLRTESTALRRRGKQLLAKMHLRIYERTLRILPGYFLREKYLASAKCIFPPRVYRYLFGNVVIQSGRNQPLQFRVLT
jgi:hypothetical protein